jgi:hypothetical protein
MASRKLNRWRPLRNIAFLGMALVTVLATTPYLHAADPNDFDPYKVRISGFWFYSSPSGDLQGSTESGVIDLQKDLGFANYSTFSGKLDWKVTHKNHFYLAASPFSQSRQTVLARTIVFQGQTFSVGLGSKAQLKANLYAPGYQYDIIRRKRGNLGLAAQIDLFDSSASINAAAQVTNDGAQHGAVSAKGSLLAPIPVFGPQFRYYLTDSPRVFVEGNLLGMYLFGYGNFVSTADTVGVTVSKHLSVNAGYQLGSRLVVNNKSNDRIGLRLTQKGAIVGVEASF